MTTSDEQKLAIISSKRRRKASRHVLVDAAASDQRLAEIAVQQVAHVAAVLHADRAVEAHLVAQRDHLAGVASGPSAMRAGSPGTTRATTKITTESPE